MTCGSLQVIIHNKKSINSLVLCGFSSLTHQIPILGGKVAHFHSQGKQFAIHLFKSNTSQYIYDTCVILLSNFMIFILSWVYYVVIYVDVIFGA
jgi:hypothetical protein